MVHTYRLLASLEAKSPFELVSVSARTFLKPTFAPHSHWRHGFLHSFTTGATVDGRCTRSGVDDRLHVAVSLCHDPDTWTMTNGMP